MFYRIFLLTILTIALHIEISANIIYPEFMTSMMRIYRTDEEFIKRGNLYHSTNPRFLNLFRSIYEKNSCEASKEENQELRIPRIVHQIWIGSPVPQKYVYWMQTWMAMEGWEYKLWTEEEIKTLKLYNQDLYDASTNLGEKSDIARLEILNQFGGLYVDTDFECFKPQVFNELHNSYDFYMCFEPLEHGFIHYYNMFKLCNALIASSPHHPLIEDLVINLRANYYAFSPHCGPIERTGPSYITRIVVHYEQKKLSNHRNIYLPSTFFYLFSDPEIKFYSCHPECAVELLPESAALHYWSGSWRPPHGCSESYIIRKKKTK